MNWIDIGIICLLILGFLIGIYKGFFRSFMALIAFIIAGVIAYFLIAPISGLLESIFGLQSAIEGTLANQIEGMDAALGSVASANIEELTALISGTNINAFLKTLMVNYINGVTLTEPTTVSALISVYITGFIMSAIAFTIVFLIIRAILGIITALFKRSIDKSVALSTVDQILGGFVGAAKMIMWVVVILAFSVVLSLLPVFGDVVNSTVESTIIAKWGFDLIKGLFGF